MKRFVVYLAVLPLLAAVAAQAAPVSQNFKLDHFGYRPADSKIAIVTMNPGASVQIRTPGESVVYTVPSDGGSIVSKGVDGPASGDTVWWVDFSGLAALGSYHLYSPSLSAQSYDFDIRDDVYNAPMQAALKTFYYQRCGTPKAAAYAGAWSDESACHTDDAQTGPAAGQIDYGTRDLGGGWHDAGDYNKYVWGAVSTAILTMVRAYEDNPSALRADDTGIPESGNGLPDLLDELMWELDWMLKMQLPSGAVLSQMHVDGFGSDSPPSADVNQRYYSNPALESGAVAAGAFALASRLFEAEGQSVYAATLRSAALSAWTWVLGQGANSDEKVWAAAEIFRMDPTQTAASAYVDGYVSGSWNAHFLNAASYDTYAVYAYAAAPGATAAVVTNMLKDLGDQVDYIFWSDDLYRNGMPDWSYYWGSNAIRAGYGLLLLAASDLGATGSHTAQECREHALELLRFFHGQNPLGMVYLSNMAALGGEHSSFQFYHSWFGYWPSAYSTTKFLGKPVAVVEPDYPYFKGTDNFGISDNNSSLLGPAPGFVPGGPNKDYSGTGAPPLGSVYYNKFYRDWADQTEWTVRSWEITENSIGSQGPYVALAAYFVGTPVCDHDGVCDAGENSINCVADCAAAPDKDAYTAYLVKTPRVDEHGTAIAGGNALPARWIVTLNDLRIDDAEAGDPENYDIGRCGGVLRPALLNAASTLLNPAVSYLRYALRLGSQGAGPLVGGAPAAAEPHVRRLWTVQNALGTFSVRSIKAVSLLLPAALDEAADPSTPADATHYLCYRVARTGGPAKSQAVTRDAFDDCALDVRGGVSFAGSAAAGRCLSDLRTPSELCNPADKTEVEPPRSTSAVIDGSAATDGKSLLCFKARLAKKVSTSTAAALTALPLGGALSTRQSAHVRREVASGNPLQVAPGNLFPAPTRLDSVSREMLCLPSSVVASAPAP